MSDYDDEMDYQERERIEYNNFLKEKAFKLELGKTYLQESNSWAKKHYKIIFVNEHIAIGQKVYCDIYKKHYENSNSYDIFKVNTGERYNETRLCYRLTKEIK